MVVVTEDAFRRGDRAQQLAFILDYDHLQTPREDGGVGLKQRAAVAPEVIRLAIERALSAEPPFTGIAGAADVTLSPQAVAEVQGTSPHRLVAGVIPGGASSDRVRRLTALSQPD